jgi:Helicase associated domain/Type III restriction enzyme, res subunit
MASGTGKTLVSLWAAQALKPKSVLVLLPSLTLLQQTLDEWSRHNNWGKGFTYLCVCSDPTVSTRDLTDPVHLDSTDLEFRVDTSPDEVRRFIERDVPGVKVIFSTYQSSHVVSQGVRGLPPFDVAIFDEAHKTTGPQGGLFAHSLKDENIRIRKRLFLTATPRQYEIRHRDQEGDFRIVSMDDEAIYGPRAYTLTFGSAARQGIICNYKVVISVVDGQEVNEFALKHGITLVEGDLIGARWVANQIAVERAVEKTGAKRAIGHCRVPATHKENGFSLGQWVRTQRGNADTLSAPRRQQLDELGFVWDPVETDWAEGLRYLKIYKEREGHCRVPARHMENDFRLGQWVSVQRGNADTLSAPRRQQLDELGFVWDPFETDWAEGLRYLTIYKEREGHCRVPPKHIENGFRLGQWVSNRHQKKQTLSDARRQALEKLGFVWNVSR